MAKPAIATKPTKPTTPSKPTKPAVPVAAMKLDVKEVDADDVFSEVSHYRYVRDTKEGMVFTHLETGCPITLSPSVVRDNLLAADHYFSEVTVGKEDKYWTQKQIDEYVADAQPKLLHKDIPRVGDVRVKGIRTIFEDINGSHVFTVCYEKQGKELSDTTFNRLQENQINDALNRIEEAQRKKKGVATVATEVLRSIQENPVQRYEKGEDRVLRGYKVQFKSRDGRYDCVDMDIKEQNNIRPVNINTIKWLVFNGVRYVVE